MIVVTIYHHNSSLSTLLQQTQLNHVIAHAYSLLDILSGDHILNPE